LFAYADCRRSTGHPESRAQGSSWSQRYAVSVYRLAPEYPFPAALEDVQNAYLAMLDDVTNTDRVSIAADSSGAGLAFSLLLALRASDRPMPGHVLLMSPWVDLSGQSQQYQPEDSPLIVTPEKTSEAADLYLAGHPADDPLLNPLAADLSGLPPLLVQIGTGDNLITEARWLVDRAVEHGVDASLDLYPVATHDFHLFWSFLPEAADALHRAGTFLAEGTAATETG
jgi:monoterpene epsilon-lactone hydrolase